MKGVIEMDMLEGILLDSSLGNVVYLFMEKKNNYMMV